MHDADALKAGPNPPNTERLNKSDGPPPPAVGRGAALDDAGELKGPSPPSAEANANDATPPAAGRGAAALDSGELKGPSPPYCEYPKSAPDSRANSTKIPILRKNPQKIPTDPGRCGKEGSKGGIKNELNAQAPCRKTLISPPDDRQTPARCEARNHRGEDAKMLGPLPSGPQHTGRAD